MADLTSIEILGIGVAVRDVAVRVGQYPAPDKKLPSTDFRETGGGAAPGEEAESGHRLDREVERRGQADFPALRSSRSFSNCSAGGALLGAVSVEAGDRPRPIGYTGLHH